MISQGLALLRLILCAIVLLSCVSNINAVPVKNAPVQSEYDDVNDVDFVDVDEVETSNDSMKSGQKTVGENLPRVKSVPQLNVQLANAAPINAPPLSNSQNISHVNHVHHEIKNNTKHVHHEEDMSEHVHHDENENDHVHHGDSKEEDYVTPSRYELKHQDPNKPIPRESSEEGQGKAKNLYHSKLYENFEDVKEIADRIAGNLDAATDETFKRFQEANGPEIRAANGSDLMIIIPFYYVRLAKNPFRYHSAEFLKSHNKNDSPNSAEDEAFDPNNSKSYNNDESDNDDENSQGHEPAFKKAGQQVVQEQRIRHPILANSYPKLSKSENIKDKPAGVVDKSAEATEQDEPVRSRRSARSLKKEKKC